MFNQFCEWLNNVSKRDQSGLPYLLSLGQWFVSMGTRTCMNYLQSALIIHSSSPTLHVTCQPQLGANRMKNPWLSVSILGSFPECSAFLVLYNQHVRRKQQSYSLLHCSYRQCGACWSTPIAISHCLKSHGRRNQVSGCDYCFPVLQSAMIWSPAFFSHGSFLWALSKVRMHQAHTLFCPLFKSSQKHGVGTLEEQIPVHSAFPALIEEPTQKKRQAGEEVGFVCSRK